MYKNPKQAHFLILETINKFQILQFSSIFKTFEGVFESWKMSGQSENRLEVFEVFG